MVLSNKKLKQKLRLLLAKSITATKSPVSVSVSDTIKDGDLKKQVESIKEILGSKPKPKRERKRKPKTPPLSSEVPVPKEEVQETKKKKEKKRKRDESEVSEGSVPIEKKNKKSKRKPKTTPLSSEDPVPNEEGEETKKKKKEKKRTRDESEVSEGSVPIEKKNKNKKSKSKKKKSKNKKSKNKEEKIDEEEKKDTEKVVEEVTQIDESEVKKVYVGGMPYYSTEEDIRYFFEGCGTITEIDCMRFPETGKFRGIAMLTFKTEAAAKKALALDGADMGGFYLKIQPYKLNRPQKPQKSEFAPKIVDGYNRVYVGNLSWDITEDDLKKFFSDCKVSNIRFGTDKTTGEFKGYAHVDFSDSVSLTIALKLDQQIVCGRPARITCAVPRKVGEATNTSKKPSIIATKESNDNKVEDVPITFPTNDTYEEPEETKVEAIQTQTTGTSKKKRRTCYVCGIPGHISSDCPQKKDVDANVEKA